MGKAKLCNPAGEGVWSGGDTTRDAGLPLHSAQRMRGCCMRDLERIFRSSHLSFLNCLELLECLVNTMRRTAFSASCVRSVVG